MITIILLGIGVIFGILFKIYRALNLATKYDSTKGYFLGHRVHHGTVGGGLFLLGLKIGSPYIIGFGLGLMLDDFGDIDKWLEFEKGGDPNSFISFEK